jgi:hypothetical protein
MKKIIIAAVMLFSLNVGVQAQSVVKSGNTFTQVSNNKGGKSGGKETKTQYTYKDSKGNVYPVYLSASGKAFIKKASKKTGKEYKQYLPEVGKQINPKAYKEDKK